MKDVNDKEESFNEWELVQKNMLRCLEYTKGNVTEAARLLSLDRRTLQLRLKNKMNIDLSKYRELQGDNNERT